MSDRPSRRTLERWRRELTEAHRRSTAPSVEDLHLQMDRIEAKLSRLEDTIDILRSLRAQS